MNDAPHTQVSSSEHRAIARAVAEEMRLGQPEGLAGKARDWRAILGASVLALGLIGGAITTFVELDAKPTKEWVDTRVDEKLAPVKASTVATEVKASEAAKTAAEAAREVEKALKRDQYMLQQMTWQGDVIEHLASKKRGKPTPKPSTLRDLEIDLIAD